MIQVGDIVQLKGGSARMTVTHIRRQAEGWQEPKTYVQCMWTKSHRDMSMECITVSIEALKKVEE